MKNRRSNWQMAASGILIFAVWFGALPVYAQTRQDGKGVGVKVVSELPSKEKRWALIVGIDEYQNDVSTLKGSVNDARALKNVLVNNAGFPENQIILLTTDSAEQDKRPTRENILGALIDLYSRVPEDGLLLFSFSGHGISVGNQAFLIPSNGRFTKNLTLLKNFSIDVSIIKEAIQEIKVKQVLMLLDACRNEPGKGDTPNALTDAYKNGFSFDVANSDVNAFATLYATSIGERAYEFYDKDTKQFRGYFSHAVEEALKGKAANEKGEVTLSRLIDYLETTVPKKVKYDKGETQIPSASYSETYRANQLILAVANKSESNSLSPAQIAWNKFRGLARRLVKYDYISPFSEELAEVCVGKYPDSKCGFIDILGNETIKLKYNSVESFKKGLAKVKLNGLYGFIDKNGKEVVPIKYVWVWYEPKNGDLIQFHNSDSYYGYVNNTGQEVIPAKYENLQFLSENLFQAYRNKKHGFLDKSGNEVIPFIYEGANSFSEGLAAVKLNNKYGFINSSGQTILPFTYDGAFSFTKGLAAVARNGKWGLINKKGQLVVPFLYDELIFYGLEENDVKRKEFGDYYVAINNKKIGLIDLKGNQVLPIKFDIPIGAFSEGLVAVTINGKWGYVNLKGETIIPLKYDEAYGFEDGIAHVKLNGKEGFIDKNGKTVIPFEFDAIFAPSEGKLPIKVNGKYGFIDYTGKKIIQPLYDDFWCYTLEEKGFIGVILNGKKGFIDIYGNEYFDF